MPSLKRVTKLWGRILVDNWFSVKLKMKFQPSNSNYFLCGLRWYIKMQYSLFMKENKNLLIKFLSGFSLLKSSKLNWNYSLKLKWECWGMANLQLKVLWWFYLINSYQIKFNPLIWTNSFIIFAYIYIVYIIFMNRSPLKKYCSLSGLVL